MGKGGGDGYLSVSPQSIEGSSFGGKALYFGVRIETWSEQLGQDLSHSFGSGTSSGYPLSLHSNLRAGGCGRGVRSCRFGCPGRDLMSRCLGITTPRN